MSELQIFNHPDFGQVRTVTLNDEPWFVGKDVARVLGYKNPQEAIRTHVDPDDKGVSEILTPGGKQQIPVINESGLYSLILSSKLPRAKEFKRWVTSEVLPSIRKTGAYRSGTALDAETLIRCSEIMAECRPENRPYVLNILRQVIPGIDCVPERPPALDEAPPFNRYGSYGKGFNRTALALLLVDSGYSLSEVARRIGCNKGVISKWMHGKMNPCLDYRERLCNLFNVPYGYFDL